MRLLKFIGDAPRFVEIRQNGQPTGRAVEGVKARLLQHKLDNGFNLPRGWVRDWRWENRGPYEGQGGRRHAFFAPRSESLRIVTQADINSCRGWFDKTWNGICKWHPISQDYVWSSHVWNWVAEVEDDDAPVIFYACYGEFSDITDLVIRDDIRSLVSA